MTCKFLTFTDCQGEEFRLGAQLGVSKLRTVDSHPYHVKELRVWLRTNCQCKIPLGSRVSLCNETWRVWKLIDAVPGAMVLELVRPELYGCQTRTIYEVTITEDMDTEEATSVVGPRHEGLLWLTTGQLDLSHNSRGWRQAARLYFPDGLPDMTGHTHLRVDGAIWKPLASEDVHNIDAIPFLVVMDEPRWPYTAP